METMMKRAKATESERNAWFHRTKKKKQSCIHGSTYQWKFMHALNTFSQVYHIVYVVVCITLCGPLYVARSIHYVIWESVKWDRMPFRQTVLWCVSLWFNDKRIPFKSHTVNLRPFIINVLQFGTFLFIPWLVRRVLFFAFGTLKLWSLFGNVIFLFIFFLKYTHFLFVWVYVCPCVFVARCFCVFFSFLGIFRLCSGSHHSFGWLPMKI